jgi:hypothetical protein
MEMFDRINDFLADHGVVRAKLPTPSVAVVRLQGVIGAVGFRAIGYGATIPLAVVLLGLAAVPAVDDVRRALRDERRSDG